MFAAWTYKEGALRFLDRSNHFIADVLLACQQFRKRTVLPKQLEQGIVLRAQFAGAARGLSKISAEWQLELPPPQDRAQVFRHTLAIDKRGAVPTLAKVRALTGEV